MRRTDISFLIMIATLMVLYIIFPTEHSLGVIDVAVGGLVYRGLMHFNCEKVVDDD